MLTPRIDRIWLHTNDVMLRGAMLLMQRFVLCRDDCETGVRAPVLRFRVDKMLKYI